MGPTSDGPVGVLAGGSAGVVVADALVRVLPHEDLLLLADHAYAPYARRHERVVADRVVRLAGELGAAGAKLVVVATAAVGEDALPALASRAGVGLVGLAPAAAHAAARARRRPVAVVVGDGCVRPLPFTRELRRARGASRLLLEPWPGLRELVEGGPAAGAELRRLVAARAHELRVAGVGAVALACPHAAAIRPLLVDELREGALVVDVAELTARRVRLLLRRSGLEARRRRGGRRLLMSSDPVRGAAGLAARRRA